AWLFEA
nr:Chain B, peptide [Escherichia coli]3RRJ_B Chain B, peptide [Escherichia coli]3RS8_B Chain B, Unknown peptide, probably from expression host [Escherichia coli]3RS9_B Chain B, Unknown peptide, probably from expression host [Escherichia coli BL21(DE3)]3RSG_B Chain B, Unknown peptide, probably from expression host [Escherichia coli BL21(DE3)]3RSQ_B Chain B, Unknown peptide, probably from expression host [Escherichia coli BL21(DE3)]3RT9_B Chain B, Unknown peptide, probably from expression host 